MAITHFTLQIISRGNGRSAVAAAAYRHSARMENQREDRQVDFTNKPGMVHDEFALPENAPEWAKAMVADRTTAECAETFWNKVETFEVRKDAQLAKELILALPMELTVEQNIALMRDFVSANITSKGLIADCAYHDAQGNPHVHLMTNLRPLTEDGFGAKKVAVLDESGQPLRSKSGQIVYKLWAGDKADFLALREAWYAAQNRHLQLNGHDVRVDGRSYAERGIDLVPTPHIGVPTKNIQREAEAEGRDAQLERLMLHAAARRENAARITAKPETLIDAVSRERSVFDERDLARFLHRYVDDADVFRNLMARIMASPELVMIEAEGVDFATGEVLLSRYSTREMIRIEAEMASRAEALSSQGRFGVAASTRNEVFSAQSRLSDEQRNAIERVTGNERLAMVIGHAGAGKTTMMSAAREIWQAEGFTVVGGALAGKAAEGLEKEAGIASRTLASWQLQWQRGRLHLDDKTVFVMDEAGMVASRQMADFVAEVDRSGAKLVLVGDAGQLQPIEAGGAFASLSGITGYAELETIYRQSEDWMRQASMRLARGDVETALVAYNDRGHVIETATKAAAMAALVKDWIGDYDPNRSSLILAFMRRDVRALNELARSALIERGQLSEGYEFRTAEGVRNFAAGDQIVFLRNENSIGVMNGMIGRVVTAEKGRIVARIGDASDGSNKGRQVEIDHRFYNNVDHGYATTVHKSQGATVDRVKVLASSMFDRHLAYVALTRHRQSVELYAAADEFRRYARVDHMAGITGRLLDAGMAKFRVGDDVSSSPYVDIQDRNGITHRLWGVSLPNALERAGASIGDVVTLRKDGSEEVIVKIPVIDEATGAKHFEERAVERNVWTGTIVRESDPVAQRIAAAALFARPGRIDHAAGVTGELVEAGEAKFHDRADVEPTPYADLKAADGTVHRLWGTTIPKAIEAAGAHIGDHVTLRRDGTEDIKILVPVVNDATGTIRPEERVVERNIWTALIIETAAQRTARQDSAAKELSSQPSHVFQALVARLSRSGAKGTTLDYAGSRFYDQALAYANNRGLYGIRVATALAKNHGRWVSDQRTRLAALGTKLAGFIGRFGRNRSVRSDPAATAAQTGPWLRGVATWAQSIGQVVEAGMQGDAALSVHWTDITARMKLIYERPEDAMKAMDLSPALTGNDASAKAGQVRILDQLASNPVMFGALRGKTGLLASGSAKATRQRAVENVAPLRKSMQDYIRLRAEIADLRSVELTRERDRQRLDIPAISNAAGQVLERIRDAIDRNDVPAAMGFALADKQIKAEIDALNKSLEQKFGSRTFGGGAAPKGKSFDAAAAKVAPGDHVKLAGAWPLFNAAQKLAAHEKDLQQQQARAQTQSRGPGLTR